MRQGPRIEDGDDDRSWTISGYDGWPSALIGNRGPRRRKRPQERPRGSDNVLSGEPVPESPRNSMSCGGFSPADSSSHSHAAAVEAAARPTEVLARFRPRASPFQATSRGVARTGARSVAFSPVARDRMGRRSTPGGGERVPISPPLWGEKAERRLAETGFLSTRSGSVRAAKFRVRSESALRARERYIVRTGVRERCQSQGRL